MYEQIQVRRTVQDDLPCRGRTVHRTSRHGDKASSVQFGGKGDDKQIPVYRPHPDILFEIGGFCFSGNLFQTNGCGAESFRCDSDDTWNRYSVRGDDVQGCYRFFRMRVLPAGALKIDVLTGFRCCGHTDFCIVNKRHIPPVGNFLTAADRKFGFRPVCIVHDISHNERFFRRVPTESMEEVERTDPFPDADSGCLFRSVSRMAG